MKKNRVSPAKLEKLLKDHDLQLYDICKICNICAATAERYKKQGIPEAHYKLIALSLGDL